MKVIDVAQLSPEWFAARCGVPSASNFDKIVTATGAPSKQAEKYLWRLAGERITGIAEETYQNAAMLRGIELEVEARKLYELTTGETVRQVGFCLEDDGYGCSPDGLVGDEGMIQIKCPIMTTHVGYLLNGGPVSDYFQQIQGELLVTGSKWSDLMCYYPGMKPSITRIERDEGFIKKLKVELENFIKELEETVKTIS